MSRIGRKPITIPAGVTVEVADRRVKVTGSKGTLEQPVLPGILVAQENGVLTLTKEVETAETGRLYGLMRTLIDNMVVGVSQGFERKLEINGVGFRAAVAGNAINLSLGFSHPVVFNLPQGIEAKIEKNVITLSGFDKQLVGQVAANLRDLKKPEPYKGKGIKYAEEQIKRKAGKTATKG
ncbi:MAG TPA: 50S ribosomal protein L6 [Candidatus Saccharimonadia bacterium]|jgi:large subunit ribosomal protein L6|nr:50S ribosomal protein L6 [Candidatus Saccharimonadia bacterium]